MSEKKVFSFVSISSTNAPPAKTGSWRRVAPSYQDRTAPCTDLCPCAENIPAWTNLLAKGKFEAAWRELTKENPFPLLCGRVCYRFCEANCNRKGHDDPVSVNALERFLGEYAVKHALRPEVAQREQLQQVRVAVIGGGPAGLSTAHFLAREGCAVTLFDENAELGGVPNVGIPAYRMPNDLLRREIEAMVTGIGVRVHLDCQVGPSFLKNALLGYTYIVLAIGAHKERKLFGDEAQDLFMESGVRFLKNISSGQLTKFHGSVRHVAVVGGGNTAIDVARSARRLGASTGTKVTVVYRRSETEMPAHRDEIEAAKREGVEFLFLALPRFVLVTEDGRTMLTCDRMALDEADASGRRTVHAIEGSTLELECDVAISAIGEESDMASLVPPQYHFETEGDTNDGKVLCIGDALYGPRSVSEAIASGKKAAQLIIERETGIRRNVSAHDVVGASEIKWHYVNKRRSDPKIRNEKKLSRRDFENFAETTRTISQKMAVVEATRCINCGTCIACDRCVSFCPDYAITKGVDGKYTIDLDYCKGCGICAEVCERSVIHYGKDGSNV